MKMLKTSNFLLIVAAFFLISSGNLFAQSVKGNKKVVKEERTVGNFKGIEVGGAFNVFITQQEKTTLTIEADENLMDQIQTAVHGDVLKISSKQIKNATKLNVYVSSPEITYLEVSGAATLESENTIKTQNLEVEASGASNCELNIDVDELKTKASGASNLVFSGKANKHIVNASGASEVKAGKLETANTDAVASGAANVSINATESVKSSSSGAGNISVAGNPEIITSGRNINNNDKQDNLSVKSWQDGDTTTVKVGGVTVEVIDGDSTKVTIGNHRLVVDDDGNVQWERNRNNKFNGHWAGLELGVNGYVDKDFNINVPEEYDFLTLKYEKSIDVNINFFEQNINLYDNKLGLVTGMGLRWNNYRFNNNVVLSPDSAQIYGYRDNSRDWQKSKLVVNYLNIPLLLEYQSNRFSSKNSFHAAAGVIFGWRYASHTKMLYYEDGRRKPKESDSFHLNPFRYDATLRVGWGIIDLYATYSFNTLFKDGHGPELYPFSVGITILNF